MKKKKKVVLIVLAVVCLIVGAIIVYFAFNPIHHSYKNEQGEWRVSISGAEYKLLSDSGWQLDYKRGDKIGYLDGLRASLFECEGDIDRNIICVQEILSSMKHVPLIRQDIALGNISAENVNRIEFIEPDLSNVNNYYSNVLNETTERSLFKDFFNAYNNIDMRISVQEVPQTEIEDKFFVLRCYNSSLPTASVSYQVISWGDIFLCYNIEADAYSIIPNETVWSIAG